MSSCKTLVGSEILIAVGLIIFSELKLHSCVWSSVLYKVSEVPVCRKIQAWGFKNVISSESLQSPSVGPQP